MTRYGLTRIDGVWTHRSGAVIVQTEGWEGPRSRNLKRWEIGRMDERFGVTVGDDGRLFRTLREAARALDAAQEARA